MTDYVTLKGRIESIKQHMSGTGKPYTNITITTLDGKMYANVWDREVPNIVREGVYVGLLCEKRESQGRTFYNLKAAESLSEKEIEKVKAGIESSGPKVNGAQSTPIEERLRLPREEAIVRQTMFKCAAQVMQGTNIEANNMADYAFVLEKRFYEGSED